jgi:hypothetical protein
LCIWTPWRCSEDFVKRKVFCVYGLHELIKFIKNLKKFTHVFFIILHIFIKFPYAEICFEAFRRPCEALDHLQRAAHGCRSGVRRRDAAPSVLQVGRFRHGALRRRPQLHLGSRHTYRNKYRVRVSGLSDVYVRTRQC